MFTFLRLLMLAKMFVWPFSRKICVYLSKDEKTMNKKTFTNNGTAAADANEQINNNFLKEEKHGKLVYLFYDKIEYTCPTTKKLYTCTFLLLIK